MKVSYYKMPVDLYERVEDALHELVIVCQEVDRNSSAQEFKKLRAIWKTEVKESSYGAWEE